MGENWGLWHDRQGLAEWKVRSAPGGDNSDREPHASSGPEGEDGGATQLPGRFLDH